MDAINSITVPSGVDLVQRIVEEEGMTTNYRVRTATALWPGKNSFISVHTPRRSSCLPQMFLTCVFSEREFVAVQLTVRPYGFVTVGTGPSVYVAHEDAARECLVGFRTIMIADRVRRS